MEKKLFGELFCIKNHFPKYFAKCCNLLYLFKFFVPCITIISWNDALLYHRINQISFKVHILCSLMTYFSGTRVYEIVNDCLSLQFVRVHKERRSQYFCSTEKWMMLDIVVENIFKIMTVQNNLVFNCRF